jgi:predicted nucleic acid-binding protein
MIIVDSDVLIDALAGRKPSVDQVSRGLEAGSLATTAISVFELLSGARTPGDLDRIETLLGALAVIPFDAAAGRAAAGMRRDLEARGESIGMADCQIAAICVSRSATLLTRNRRHFERIDSLELAEL